MRKAPTGSVEAADRKVRLSDLRGEGFSWWAGSTVSRAASMDVDRRFHHGDRGADFGPLTPAP